MSARSERFKKRKAIRESFQKESHLKDISTSEEASKLLSGEVDFGFVNTILEKRTSIYNLEVSETEVNDSLALLDKNFTKDKYNVLFKSSKDVLIDQLLKPLHLSRSDLSDVDRDFSYNRGDYLKSPKGAGGEGIAFDAQRKQSKQDALNNGGKIQDKYTGQNHIADKMDLDHIVPLKDFHDRGGYILSDVEKRQFGADGNNHAFTNQNINRSKGAKTLEEFANANQQVDKRRTNALVKNGEKSVEKLIPLGKIEKTKFVAKRGAKDGLKTGFEQGIQQAIGTLLSEFISATFSESKDIFSNGWKNGQYDLSWVEALKLRLNNVKIRLLDKWKNVVLAFKDGAIAGFFSAIITAIINMFVRTGKNIVRIIREGFMSLMKALKALISPPDGMTLKQAAHEASKVFASGLVVTGGIFAGEIIDKKLLALGIPFSGTISMVLAGLISGLGSLFVVYMIDKMDLFGVEAKKRHKFIMGELEPKISSNIEKSEEIIKRLELEYS